MAWKSPITWVVGQLVTAAQLNEQLRDNLLALWKGQAAGDLDYYTGATAKGRLAAGLPGQVLRMAAGGLAPEWGAPFVMGMIQRTSEFTTSSATFVNVTSALVTLTLPGPGSILVLGSGTMRISGAGHEAHLRATVDGVGDDSTTFVSAYDSGDLGWRPFGYAWLKTGLLAGDRAVRLQLRTTDSGAAARVAKATLIAIGLPD